MFCLGELQFLGNFQGYGEICFRRLLECLLYKELVRSMIFGLLAYRSEDLCVFELEFSSRAGGQC